MSNSHRPSLISAVELTRTSHFLTPVFIVYCMQSYLWLEKHCLQAIDFCRTATAVGQDYPMSSLSLLACNSIRATNRCRASSSSAASPLTLCRLSSIINTLIRSFLTCRFHLAGSLKDGQLPLPHQQSHPTRPENLQQPSAAIRYCRHRQGSPASCTAPSIRIPSLRFFSSSAARVSLLCT